MENNRPAESKEWLWMVSSVSGGLSSLVLDVVALHQTDTFCNLEVLLAQVVSDSCG